MLSVIVLGMEAKQTALESACKRISELAPQAQVLANCSAGSLQQTIGTAHGEQILFVDSAAVSSDSFEALLNDFVTGDSRSIKYATVEHQGETLELAGLSIDNLIDYITRHETWPLAMVAMPAELFKNNESMKIENEFVFLAETIVQAIGEQYSMQHSIASMSGSDRLRFTQLEQAAILSRAVNSCNIEELFPNHAWKEHERESAAACYHALAAQFIRLGDNESAKECLAFSDQLEDSPRSLALKALISLGKGETLGAVANMVSSLQQYEVRKKNEDNAHYLTFTPADLEVINTNLNQGLAELNKRNNKGAFEHFANAVFNFDTFYSEMGVDELIN